MNKVIDVFKNVVVQIATPYSRGTGFYLQEYDLIVTNEHVVRGNRQVVVDGLAIKRQLSQVLYTDEKYDLAFLEVSQQIEVPDVRLGTEIKITVGDSIMAIGHPFGLKFAATQGIVSNTKQEQNGVLYIHHDAALNPGNSGGPLVNEEGLVVGVNSFIMQSGNSAGFALPISYLEETLKEFRLAEGQSGTRCRSCSNLVFKSIKKSNYCPFCGAKIQLPCEVEAYEPVGIPKTIEQLLEQMGYDVRLSRLGPNNWEIHQGSANISISYYEKTGLIMGDAYLCCLPKEKGQIKPLYEYLLRQNYLIENLSFSIQNQEIILSLLIHDRYLNVDTGVKLFKHLFIMADHYDNILVEEYGAYWKMES